MYDRAYGRGGNMDVQQAAKMIEWLDEERRRDKSTIATLQERLVQQQELMDTLSRRVQSMESDQATLRSQASSPSRDVDLMDQMRREMSQAIASIEAKRLTAEREAERRIELARETAMRPLRELTDKLGKIERTTTELPAINVEQDRLLTIVAALQVRVDDLFKRLEDPDRRLAQLEEQRRTDARRLSEIESDLPEVRKQLEGVKPKIALLEDLALRNERKITDMVSGDRDRREQIQQFIDQQNLQLQQRDQQVQEVTQKAAENDENMKRYAERFESWAEAYRDMKKIIDDFERIGDRLERRINEVAEMQRLSEDRFRQEWNDWRADDQKRWKQFTLSNDEVWRQHDREFERFVKRIAEIDALFPPLQDSLNRIWNLERQRAQMYRERYQALLLEFDTITGPGATPASPRSTSTVPAVTPPTPASPPTNGQPSTGSTEPAKKSTGTTTGVLSTSERG
jgi:chromosome segregation ATPase